MEFGFTADLHLGINQERDLVTLHCVEKMFSILREKNIRSLIIAGDIFDRAILNSNHNPIAPIMDILETYSEVFVNILSGTPSHDVPGSLAIFEHLDNVRVIDEPKVFFDDTFNWMYVPEPTKGEMARRSRGDMVEMDYSAGVINLLNDLRKVRDKEFPTILIGHLSLVGSTVGSGWELTGPISPKSILTESGADLALLGHVHQRQSFEQNSVRYCGSPAHLDFGDTEPEKGFEIIRVIDMEDMEGDPDDAGISFVEVGDYALIPEFVPLPSRRFVTVEITGLMIEEPLIMLDGWEKSYPLSTLHLEEEDTKGADVKVKIPTSIRDDADGPAAIEKVMKALEDCAYSVRREWVHDSVQQVIRSERINQIAVLADEVREWGDVNNVEITPEIETKTQEAEITAKERSA